MANAALLKNCWLRVGWPAIMLSKNKRPYDPGPLDAEQRLVANVENLFATNTLSARRSQELLNDIAGVGVARAKPLAKPVGTNAARDLRRSFLKRSQWPALYWADVRVLNLKTGQEELQSLAFVLPHEYLHVLAKLGDPSVLYAKDNLDRIAKEHLAKCESLAKCELVGIGLWGDGVPCNWDRTESVECFAINLPGQAGQYQALRLPLTALSRKQVSPNTWDDIMEVLAWSFQCLAVGEWPGHRHDDAPWRPDDRRRAGKALTPLGVRAALVEVRGDWKMFAETFHFPKWNHKAGCCWRCTCTPAEAITII